MGVLMALSPVLQTLTQQWSSDSIYALTVCLSFIHLFLHDYNFLDAKPNDYGYDVSASKNTNTLQVTQGPHNDNERTGYYSSDHSRLHHLQRSRPSMPQARTRSFSTTMPYQQSRRLAGIFCLPITLVHSTYRCCSFQYAVFYE